MQVPTTSPRNLQEYRERLDKVVRTTKKVVLDTEHVLERNGYEVPKLRKDLQEHDEKLHEIVLYTGVVGAMKAGKSLSITAITGYDVCPHRSTACTTVPTLLQHRVGVTEPRLKFPDPQIFIECVRQLRKAIKRLDSDRYPYFAIGDSALDGLIKRIREDEEFESVFAHTTLGADNVREVLLWCNDLVRVCAQVEIGAELGKMGTSAANPLEHITTLVDLPKVEVEFESLKGKSVPGTISLIDTPGPNEKGLDIPLRRLMQAVMGRSYVNVVVLSYKDLNAVHVGQLQEDVKNLQFKQEKGRLYVLINQFDEHMSTDPSEEEIKKLVITKVLEGVSAEEVYCVSAKMASLANKANTFLRSDPDCLPEVGNQSWAEDFAKAACGVSWRKQFERNKKDILWFRDLTDSLREASNFDQPLTGIIDRCYRMAAPLSYMAVGAPTRSMIRGLHASLLGRLSGLTAELKDLQEGLAHGEEMKSRLRDLREKAKKECAEQIEECVARMKRDIEIGGDYFCNIMRDVGKDSRQFFALVNRLLPNYLHTPRDEGLVSQFGQLMGGDRTVLFESRVQCLQASSDILGLIGSSLQEYLGQCAESQSDHINHMIAQLTALVNEKIRPVLEGQSCESLTRVLGQAQHLPFFSVPPISLKDEMSNCKEAVQTVQFPTAKEVERTVRRWWTLWLWPTTVMEKIEVDETRFALAPKDFRKIVSSAINDTKMAVAENLASAVRDAINVALDSFFQEIDQVLTRTLKLLKASIEDKSRDWEYKQKLRGELISGVELLGGALEDVEGVIQELELILDRQQVGKKLASKKECEYVGSVVH